jgi:hypothetical protein
LLRLLGEGGFESGSCGGEESDGLTACDAHSGGWFSCGDRVLGQCSDWVDEMQGALWRLLLSVGLRVVFRLMGVIDG